MPKGAVQPLRRGRVSAARRVAERLGGRYSTELGIDLDAGGSEVERWFVAATLFGTRIATSVAERTFHMLEGAGLVRIDRARHIPWQDLVALLDGGGYARYDFRTATRLQTLSQIIEERYGGQVAEIGRRHQTYPALRDALDALPGWGPVTVGLFLRELRGVWPGAQPPLDPRAALAARHLGLVGGDDDQSALAQISRLARAAHLDLRDLESGLVRCALAHGTAIDQCPGGTECTLISRAH